MYAEQLPVVAAEEEIAAVRVVVDLLEFGRLLVRSCWVCLSVVELEWLQITALGAGIAEVLARKAAAVGLEPEEEA